MAILAVHTAIEPRNISEEYHTIGFCGQLPIRPRSTNSKYGIGRAASKPYMSVVGCCFNSDGYGLTRYDTEPDSSIEVHIWNTGIERVLDGIHRVVALKVEHRPISMRSDSITASIGTGISRNIRFNENLSTNITMKMTILQLSIKKESDGQGPCASL